MTTKHITIIGGGISGLCSAYYLIQKGHNVRIIEKESANHATCSIGNAGMIVPSHFIPLAAPGIITQGLKWMFDSKSPFFIRPRMNKNLLQWIWLFYRSANAQHVQHSIPVLRDYNLLSKQLFQEMHQSQNLQFQFKQKGLLMLYKTIATEKEEIILAELANNAGIEAKICSPQQISDIEPNVEIQARGAIYFPGDAHLNPVQFIQSLKQHLKNKNVDFCYEEEVKDMFHSQGKITKITTGKGEYLIDELLLCAGAWSGRLAQKLKLQLPMQGGKGYSFDLKEVNNIQIPSILCEAKVAVTPMGGFTRFAGTMEINGTNLSINQNRIQGIVKAIPKYYTHINPPKSIYKTIWSGLRPCSPDGLPYMGKSNFFTNLTIATGHAMMGLSMGPATGKLVSEIIDNERTSIDINLLKVSRFA